MISWLEVTPSCVKVAMGIVLFNEEQWEAVNKRIVNKFPKVVTQLFLKLDLLVWHWYELADPEN